MLRKAASMGRAAASPVIAEGRLSSRGAAPLARPHLLVADGVQAPGAPHPVVQGEGVIGALRAFGDGGRRRGR